MKEWVDSANPAFLKGSLFTEFLWGDIPDKEVKLVDKQNSKLSVIDFLQKSLKAW